MNHFGRILQLEIFGESHGKMVGIILDGIPAGIPLSADDFKEDLGRRKAGGLGTTPRIETDEPFIASGVFNGYTTGGAICIYFENNNTKSKDYSNLVNHPRPSHADFVAMKKYDGFADYRGGGAFSARLTLGLVAAGVVAKKIIKHISFETKITNLGGVEDPALFEDILKNTISLKDSVGGIVKVTAKGVEVGLGEPYFDSLESCIAHLLYSVGGVKGVSFGTGFDGVALSGSEFNDCIIDETGKTKTNHSGGINGGISNGNDIIVNVFVKPTASIFKSQETYHFKNQQVEPLILEGRHDSAIILRAQVVLEACVAIALADAYLIRKTQK
ncbi:MAG: chorismate synthase [Anaeroplasmataceae bacterium]|nr:chorismate synthase [Anaeroplasmataceae bacterium]